MEREQLRERRAQIRARHDGVDEPVRKRELGGLEALGELLLDGVANHALAREADERMGLREDDVALHGERRGDAARRRVGDDRDVGQAALGQTRKRAGHLRHLHERRQALLHARAARSGERHDRQSLVGRAAHEARHLLADGRAHRPHEEGGFHDRERRTDAGNAARARANSLVKARFLTQRRQLLGVTRELERVGLGHMGVPFLEAAGVEQIGDALVGGHAEIAAAGRAHVVRGGEAFLGELQPAMGTRTPLVDRGRRLLRGAQHPAERRGVVLQRAEDVHAARDGTRKEAVDLAERLRLVAQEHRARAAFLGRIEHGVRVAEQGVGVLLAQAHRARRLAQIGLEALVGGEGQPHREAGVGGSLHILPGHAAARHEQHARAGIFVFLSGDRGVRTRVARGNNVVSRRIGRVDGVRGKRALGRRLLGDPREAVRHARLRRRRLTLLRRRGCGSERPVCVKRHIPLLCDLHANPL